MLNFSIKNLNKKTDPNWKLIADIMLYSLPLVIGVVTTMPVSENVQKWAIVYINVIVIIFKAISKFTEDKTYYGKASNQE